MRAPNFVAHSIYIQNGRKNLRRSKAIPPHTMCVVSLPRTIRKKIINGKNIVIHGTDWDKYKIEKLTINSKKLDFTTKIKDL